MRQNPCHLCRPLDATRIRIAGALPLLPLPTGERLARSADAFLMAGFSQVYLIRLPFLFVITIRGQAEAFAPGRVWHGQAEALAPGGVRARGCVGANASALPVPPTACPGCPRGDPTPRGGVRPKYSRRAGCEHGAAWGRMLRPYRCLPGALRCRWVYGTLRVLCPRSSEDRAAVS